jgi:cobalamin synthase
VLAAQPIFHVFAFGVNVMPPENVTLPVVVILLFMTRVPVKPVQFTTLHADAISIVIVLFPVVAVSIAVSPAIG